MNKQYEHLDAQNENQKLKFKKTGGKPSSLIGLIFILLGIITLGLCFIYKSSILMIIGLATTFWASLLLFVRPTRYVRDVLVSSTVMSSAKTIEELITSLNFTGKVFYLPAAKLEDSDIEQVFISKTDDFNISSANKISQQKVNVAKQNGIYLFPTGVDLANLFEKELGRRFTKFSTDSLTENLPKVLVESFELMKKCEISFDGNIVTVEMVGLSKVFSCNGQDEDSFMRDSVTCPFLSAIFCALTRTTGKVIKILEKNVSGPKKIISLTCELMED